MRIAIVAPPYYGIPPQGYGGTELICYLLAEGLVERDHDVTVIGAGPRRTRARFIATFPQPQPVLSRYLIRDVPGLSGCPA
jgi:hypothetical protein